MKLSQMIEAPLAWVNGARDVDITHLTIDSRTCKKGSLYFAISGTRVDGHGFVQNAYQNGAVAAVVEHEVPCPIPQVVVPNTRAAMSHMAAAYYGFPAKKMKMLGVTGTNGKTSISYMLRAIAAANGISCGVIGTSGIYLDHEKLDIPILTATTPDPIELQYALSVLADRGAKWVVMEVTAHALDLHKVEGISFLSAGFTNLTQDHLDYFGTMERYQQAKKKLFTPALAQNGVVNIDDEMGRELVKEKNIPLLTYGIGGKCDLRAENIVIEPTQSRFDLYFQQQIYPVVLHSTGLFNISNALCALGCALQAGVPMNDCVRALALFSGVAGRFESVDTQNRGFTVIIDYAHTPDGLENVLQAIRRFKKGRLICVFGCGGDRDSAKRPIMGRIAGELADYTVLTSDNPRFEDAEKIIDQIEAGIQGAHERITDRRRAIYAALQMAKKDDVIAICGKGDEDYQDIQGHKNHFSDREVAGEWFTKE